MAIETKQQSKTQNPSCCTSDDVKPQLTNSPLSQASVTDFKGMSSKSSENQMEEKKKEKNQVVGYMDKNISILQNQGSEG